MPNIAETVKKQTDRILRQRQLNGTEGVTVVAGPGGGSPVITNPGVDLAAHKTSGDHDGRYYTESEIDGMLNFIALTDTPNAYTGEAGKAIVVNPTEDGLEFGEGGGELQQATETTLGGIKAKPKTTESAEVAIDTATGKLYTAAPDEAANGIPAGGTAGQVLEKIDGTNYNAQWVDPGGAGSPTGDGTEDTHSASITESNGPYTVCISFIEALSSFWLASIKYYIGSTAGSVTVNLRTAGGTLLASKNIASSSGTAWNTFTFSNPIYLEANSFYAVEVLFGSSQKIWRRAYVYSGTLWKQRQMRAIDWFNGTNFAAETTGLGLVEYDDTP